MDWYFALHVATGTTLGIWILLSTAMTVILTKNIYNEWPAIRTESTTNLFYASVGCVALILFAPFFILNDLWTD